MPDHRPKHAAKPMSQGLSPPGFARLTASPSGAVAAHETYRECLTGRPDFGRPVTDDGYVWWYVDAVSDDGRHSLTLILFIGSVFSPYYALDRRRGRGDPEQHCAVNAILYGANGKRWTMTERGKRHLERDRDRLRIGPSAARWQGDALIVDIDEWTVPLPRRSRGRIRVLPGAITEHACLIAGDHGHCWWPIAPCARIEVDFQSPALSWRGNAYLDSNSGDRPLEQDFQRWTWSRSSDRKGTRVDYDVSLRDGSQRRHAVSFDRLQGTAIQSPPPRMHPLATTGWRVERQVACDPEASPRVIETLEDTPFYARSLVETTLSGQKRQAFHESLSLTRFAHPLVQILLPFRMPRRG